MTKIKLFSPWKIKDLELKNRVVMPPMVQYIAQDGYVNEWHTQHYISRAIGQVGLIIVEASAINASARISEGDLGIYEEGHIKGLTHIVEKCHQYGSKIAIQLAHAGRKVELKNTTLLAPSALRFNDHYAMPKEMDKEDIRAVIADFKKAALRAKQAGFDAIEVHGAHGYLISSFLSPLSNQRTDAYGRNRALFLQEVLEAIGSAVDLPLLLRVSARDYHKDGNTPEKIATLLTPLDHLYDALDVSSGGIVEAPIKVYPGYQIAAAEFLKEALGKPTIGGGLLEEPKMVQRIIGSQTTDAIYLARALLKNPFWCFNAALQLGQEIDIPKPYERIKYL
ncbi:NADPH dehydrogenase [Helicobacter suis]|uniref:oxidoreductase n=1 Tax=Helicobacter suis TaxID=104628 RepID=UPI001F087177|nr:NADPH dehydrogenase [Helicobacter suis]